MWGSSSSQGDASPDRFSRSTPTNGSNGDSASGTRQAAALAARMAFGRNLIITTVFVRSIFRIQPEAWGSARPSWSLNGLVQRVVRCRQRRDEICKVVPFRKRCISRWIKQRKTGIIVVVCFFDDAKSIAVPMDLRMLFSEGNIGLPIIAAWHLFALLNSKWELADYYYFSTCSISLLALPLAD